MKGERTMKEFLKREKDESLRSWCHRLAIFYDGCDGATLFRILIAVSDESYNQGSFDKEHLGL